MLAVIFGTITKKSECRKFSEASNKIFENLIKIEAWSQISIDMDTQTAYNLIINLRKYI